MDRPDESRADDVDETSSNDAADGGADKTPPAGPIIEKTKPVDRPDDDVARPEDFPAFLTAPDVVPPAPEKTEDEDPHPAVPGVVPPVAEKTEDEDPHPAAPDLVPPAPEKKTADDDPYPAAPDVVPPLPKKTADDDPYAAAFADAPRRATIWPMVLSVVAPLAILGAAGWWLWQERVVTAQWVIPRAAALAGLDMDLTITEVGPDGLKATGLQIGGIEAEQVTATYTVGDLLRRRVESLAIGGLTVQVRQVDGAWEVDGLPRGDGGGMPDLPFADLTLSDATVSVAMANADITMTGDGAVTAASDGGLAVAWDGVADAGDLGRGAMVLSSDMRPAADGLAVDAVIEGDGALGADLGAVLGADAGAVLARAQGGGTVEVSLTLGTTRSGSFSLTDVWLEAPGRDLTIAALDGRGSFEWAAGGLGDGVLEVKHNGLSFGDWRLGPGPLTVRQQDGLATAEGLLDLPVGRFETRISGSPTAPDGPVEVALNGTLKAASAAALIAGVAADGSADVDLTGQARNLQSLMQQVSANGPPGDFAGWLALADNAGLAVDGTMDADLQGVTAPRHFSGGALQGPLEMALSQDGLEIAGLGPLEVGVSRVTMPGLDALAKVLPANLLFGGDAGTPLRLSVGRVGETFAVAVTGGVAIDGLGFGAGAEVDGAATLGPEGVEGINVPFLLAQLDGVALPGGRADVEVLLSDVAGTMDALTGAASVGLSAPLLVMNGVTLAGVTGDVDADMTWDGDVLNLTPAAGSRVNVGGVNGPNGLALDGPVALALAADAQHKIAVDRAGATTVDVALADPAPLTVRGRDGALATLDLGALRLTQDSDGINARFGGGSVTLPGRPVALSGVEGSAGFAPGRGPTADVTVGRVAHSGRPAAVVPLSAQLKVTPQGDGTLALRGSAADAGGRIRLTVEGAHDLATGRGSAGATLAQLSFVPTVLQPDALFPILSGRFNEVDADVGFAGMLNWGNGGLTVTGTVTFEARTLGVAEVKVENATGEIVFEDLVTQRTPPGQTVAVGLIDIGVPLTNGDVIVHLPGDGTVNAQLAGLEMFGGSLESDPFTVEAGDFETVLRVKGVALDQMLAATKGAGELAVSGRLDGTIPLSFIDGEASINGGQLATTAGGGVLRYAPGEVGDVLDAEEFSTGLFLEAVENFHYDSINLTLDEGEAEDLLLGLQLRGSNPDLYGGAPLELNVNLEGPLQQILTRGLATYTLPERLGTELGGGAAR